MSESRGRTSIVFTILALIFLIGPVVFVTWWLIRPEPPKKPPEEDRDRDIVCTGRVDVLDQIISLESSQAGRIVALGPKIEEGAVVEKGQIILSLDDAMAKSRRLAAEAAVQLCEIQVKQAELDASRFEKQIDARSAMVAAAGARVLAAEKFLEQRKKQSAVTPLGEAEQDAMRAQINELQQIEKAEKLQLEDLRRLNTRLSIQAATARLNAAKADLALAKSAEEECIIRAPSDGRILRLQATVGGVLYPGSPMPAIVFAPTSAGIIIRAEVDQEFLGRIKENLKVTIQDDNQTDGPTIAGRVTKLSRFVAQRRTMLLDPGEINDVRTVECQISLDGSHPSLFIGQRMRVRIHMK